MTLNDFLDFCMNGNPGFKLVKRRTSKCASLTNCCFCFEHSFVISDVNECSYSFTCDEIGGHRCTNSIGSHSCDCPLLMSFNGDSCHCKNHISTKLHLLPRIFRVNFQNMTKKKRDKVYTILKISFLIGSNDYCFKNYCPIVEVLCLTVISKKDYSNICLGCNLNTSITFS